MYKSFGDFTTTGGTREGMFNSDGTPQDLKLKAIARTYAHAFQGTPSKMSFNTTDGSFSTTFEYDAAITEPTEIYLNKAIWYSNGYKAVASKDSGDLLSSVTWQTKDNENYIQVIMGDQESQDMDGQNITITITPNAADEHLDFITQ